MTNAAQGDAITQLYIGYYGRAADPAGFAFWRSFLDQRIAAGIGEDAAVVHIAELFGSKDQAETLAQYPFLKDPATQSAIPFVLSIYQNLLNRSVDGSDDGVQFWVNQIRAGALNPGKVIKAIIDAAAATGDAQIIENKVEAANAWREKIELAGNIAFDTAAVNQSRLSLAKVGADPATLAQANSDVRDFVGKGQNVTSFNLTPAIDDITGTNGLDVFRGNAATTSSDDKVNGGAAGGSGDQLLLTGTVTIPILVDIETITFNAINDDFDVAYETLYKGVSGAGAMNRVEVLNSQFTGRDHKFVLGHAGQIAFENTTTEASKGFELTTMRNTLDILVDGLGRADEPVNLRLQDSRSLTDIVLLTKGKSSSISLSDGPITDFIEQVMVRSNDVGSRKLKLDLRSDGDGPANLWRFTADHRTSVDVELPDWKNENLYIQVLAPKNRIDMGKGYDSKDKIFAYGADDTLAIAASTANVRSVQSNIEGIERLELTGGIAHDTIIRPNLFGVSDVEVADGWRGAPVMTLKDFGGDARATLTLGKNVSDAAIKVIPTNASNTTDIFDLIIKGGANPSVSNGAMLDLTGHEIVTMDARGAIGDNYVTLTDQHLDTLMLSAGNSLLSVTLMDAASARIIDARGSTGSGGVHVNLADYAATRGGQAIFLTNNNDKVYDGDGATNVRFGAGRDTFVDAFSHGTDKLLDFNPSEDIVHLNIDSLSKTFDPSAASPASIPFVGLGDANAIPLALVNANAFTKVQTFTSGGTVNTDTTVIALKGKAIKSNAALESAMEAGGAFALRVSEKAANAGNTFFTLHSDGKNTYLSAVEAAYETTNNNQFEAGDLHAITLIEFTGVTDPSSFSGDNMIMI